MSTTFTPTSEEVRFSKNMIGLAELTFDLTTDCWNAGVTIVNPTLVNLGKGFLENYDKTALINNFIYYSHEHWDEIKARNEQFFVTHSKQIFRDLPINDVDAFGNLMTAKDKQGQRIIKQDDIDALWDFFDSQVKICIKYIHRERKLQIIQTAKGVKPQYTATFYPEIKIRHHAKLWKVALEGVPE